jgi:uncharacterized protein YaiL (DUF2058 family)
MSNDTLRNQLLGLGFKPPAPEPRRADGAKRGSRPGTGSDERRGKARPDGWRQDPSRSNPARKPKAGRSGPGRAHPREDIDLAKAYAIRSQREKDERIEAERVKQEEARLRREARARLAELLKGKGLNVADADIARHFPYGGKIKRIHVTADQLKALNAGELGVVQVDGRYLLVTAEVLAQAEQVFAPAVALKVDPDEPVADDPYSDPKFQVPDDLVW